MNMQTIQVFFLLFDVIIKLASWRMVTETMDRIGYGASKSLVRGLGSMAVIGAVLCAFPPAAIPGAILPADDFGGAMVSPVLIGNQLVSHILPGFISACWCVAGSGWVTGVCAR
jgi:hypothetical protein